jgi:hypothetical protein
MARSHGGGKLAFRGVILGFQTAQEADEVARLCNAQNGVRLSGVTIRSYAITVNGKEAFFPAAQENHSSERLLFFGRFGGNDPTLGLLPEGTIISWPEERKTVSVTGL